MSDDSKTKPGPVYETSGPWVHEPAIDRTFGSGAELPHPTISKLDQDQVLHGKLDPFPSYIALEVTNVCNIRCTHCNYRFGVAHYTRDRGFMGLETADRVLTEAAANNAAVLMNYDGEPLMNKNFMDYLTLAQGKGVKSYFNTNGTLFTKKFADEIVSFYKGSIFFSIDGNRDWFNKIRLGADYDKVVANVEYFLAANDKAGAPISVGVSLCNLGQTPEERKAFVDHWIDRVNFVSLGEVNDKNGGILSEEMTQMKIRRRPICVVPWQTLGICHNGDVVPCSIYITRANTANAILGNVYEKPLAEIWRDEPISRFRRMLISGDHTDTFCETCDRWRCQFQWPRVTEGNRAIDRNGYWTSIYNLDRGVPWMRRGEDDKADDGR
ncbi:radical SAM protein [Magnetospirillum sp. SS-4]|uniref:radical SAM protein n=1 Tax=Magnetospirillum sp. SS-4 TaxID=2681465 RepID=UPI00138253A6|nr:radical SAM protein [Magnetospirillum sp. SS-4]CAA7617726.1 hypothetical protein MTBSS4_20020 [Magnetospirillum sp. SS-4]